MTDDTFIIGKPDLPRIDVIYAYIASGPEGEGICAFHGRDGMWLPMVGADIARIESLREHAREMVKKTGQPLKLVKFSVREELETIQP